MPGVGTGGVFYTKQRPDSAAMPQTRAPSPAGLDGWETWAYRIDLYRLVPRAALLVYAWCGYTVGMWFMGLADPTNGQSTFVSVYAGVAPLLLNFYMQQGVDWEARLNTRSPMAKAEG
jgi:hypothetical protein